MDLAVCQSRVRSEAHQVRGVCLGMLIDLLHGLVLNPRNAPLIQIGHPELCLAELDQTPFVLARRVELGHQDLVGRPVGWLLLDLLAHVLPGHLLQPQSQLDLGPAAGRLFPQLCQSQSKLLAREIRHGSGRPTRGAEAEDYRKLDLSVLRRSAQSPAGHQWLSAKTVPELQI